MHTSVLLQRSIEGLALKKGMTVLDATFGAGGHSLAIAKAIGKKGKLIAFDADNNVFSQEKIQELERLTEFMPVTVNFKHAEEALKHLELDGALFDLGLSSTQLEASGRGFSFQKDEPLLMTFAANPKADDVTAKSIINLWGEESIATILKGFGEERFARSIASGIVTARAVAPIETTFQLVEIIKRSTPSRYQHGRTHPATRTFQALRMAVNDELGAIEHGVQAAFNHLKQGGRLAVISFHSIEDRMVKRMMRSLVDDGKGRAITKKPITADDEELSQNPRARSAKLRVIERI